MKHALPILSATAIAMAIMVAAAGSAADNPSATASDTPRIGHFGRALARELDLTADQRQALKDIRRTHQPVLRPLHDQAQIERAALRTLIDAPTLDEAALAAQADRIAATQREIIIASAHLRADLRKILTPEQAQKLATLRTRAKTHLPSDRRQFHEQMVEP